MRLRLYFSDSIFLFFLLVVIFFHHHYHRHHRGRHHCHRGHHCRHRRIDSIQIRLLLLLSWVSTYKNPPPLVPRFSCSCSSSCTCCCYLSSLLRRFCTSPRCGSIIHCDRRIVTPCYLYRCHPYYPTKVYVMEDGGGIFLLVCANDFIVFDLIVSIAMLMRVRI